MRKKRIQQLPLTEATTDHPKAKKLAKISELAREKINMVLMGHANEHWIEKGRKPIPESVASHRIRKGAIRNHIK